MYHYVRPDPGPDDPVGEDLSVSPENFAAQMDYLAKAGFTTMTMQELDEVRQGKIGLPKHPIVLTFDDGYRDFYTTVYPILKKHHFKATSFIITGFVGNPQYVTWDMIAEMQRSGLVEFGCHTVTHLDLSTLSLADAQHQILDAQKTLEQHLGEPILDFAYPSGEYDAQTLQVLQQGGFQSAVTTAYGWAQAGDASLELPRVRVHGAVTLAAYEAMLQ